MFAARQKQAVVSLLIGGLLPYLYFGWVWVFGLKSLFCVVLLALGCCLRGQWY